MELAVKKLKSGPPTEDREAYSRLVSIGDLIFVSNTAGKNYKTMIISSDVLDQTMQAFKNVEGALAQVGATLEDVVMSTVYVPNKADLPVVMKYVAEKFRGIDPARTVTCTPLGLEELKVELEVVAHRGVGKAKQERLSVVLD